MCPWNFTPDALSVQESEHLTPKRKHATQQVAGGEMGWSLNVIT